MLGKNIAFFAIVAIIVIAIVSSTFISDPKNYDSSRAKIFISIVTGLGIFITFFFYYNVVELQYEQQKMIFRDRLEVMDNNVTSNFTMSLENNFDKEPNFIMSLLPLQYNGYHRMNTGQEGNRHEDRQDRRENQDRQGRQTAVRWQENQDRQGRQDQEGNRDRKDQEGNQQGRQDRHVGQGRDQSIIKYTISSKIFTLWRDFVNYHNYLCMINDDKSYLVQFIQRCNSEELEKYWETMKIDYPAHTQRLGDLLFEYNKKVVNKISSEYIDTVTMMIKDQRYIDIVKDRAV